MVFSDYPILGTTYKTIDHRMVGKWRTKVDEHDYIFFEIKKYNNHLLLKENKSNKSWILSTHVLPNGKNYGVYPCTSEKKNHISTENLCYKGFKGYRLFQYNIEDSNLIVCYPNQQATNLLIKSKTINGQLPSKPFLPNKNLLNTHSSNLKSLFFTIIYEGYPYDTLQKLFENCDQKIVVHKI